MRKQVTTAARVLATSAAVVVSGGCAMKGDVRDLQVEMRALAAQQDSLIAELRNEALSTQDTLRTQSDQMFEFRGDINQSLRAIMQGLARIEAVAGANQSAIAGIRDQLANGPRMPITPPPMVVSDSLASSSGGGEQLLSGGGNPDQLWEAAMQAYDRESFSTATQAFRQFLEQYPDEPRNIEAHFNLADILTAQDRPEDAIAAFEEIRQLYPTSDRVPFAMYRIAVLQHDLGRDDESRAMIERIMNTYPGSPMAMLARELREEIG